MRRHLHPTTKPSNASPNPASTGPNGMHPGCLQVPDKKNRARARFFQQQQATALPLVALLSRLPEAATAQPGHPRQQT
jgi:hypothetical protein